MKLSAQFNYDRVDHEKDNTVHLVLTIEAPTIDWLAQRPRLCVLPVIDVSGSMMGNKFTYAQQACKKLIEQLKPGDYSGLVTFGSDAQVVVQPAEVTPEFKALLLQKLMNLHVSGGTNFSEAVTKSLKALEDLDLPPSVLHRAIFFTDGQPTNGVVDPGAIKALVTRNVGSHSMSFFGYGAGAGCDQGFLTELSQIGRGNYAYVQNPDDALAAFGRELGGLLSTYASDLRLILEPRNGHTIERVVTQLGPKQLGPAADVTDLTLELGDILAEEVRHVVLECSVKKQDKALPRDFNLFNIKATCRRITQLGDKESQELTSAAKLRFVRPEDAQTTPTEAVEQIVVLHQLAAVQKEAEAKAEKGLYVEAQGLMNQFSSDLRARPGSVRMRRVAAVASSLSSRMSSSSAYEQNKGYMVSFGRGVTRSAGVSSYDSQAALDLSEVGASTQGSSAQEAYTSIFTGPENNVQVQPPAPNLDPAAPVPAVTVNPTVGGRPLFNLTGTGNGEWLASSDSDEP